MILNEEQLSELLENMYWEFDARRSGYNQWKEYRQSERDAYKQTFRKLLYEFNKHQTHSNKL